MYTTHVRDSIGVAAVIGNARHLTHWVRVDLETCDTVPAAEKAGVYAEVDALKRRADGLASRLSAIDAVEPRQGDEPVAALVMEAREVESDYDRAFAVWIAWKVRNGLREPGNEASPGPRIFAAGATGR